MRLKGSWWDFFEVDISQTRIFYTFRVQFERLDICEIPPSFIQNNIYTDFAFNNTAPHQSNQALIPLCTLFYKQAQSRPFFRHSDSTSLILTPPKHQHIKTEFP